MSYDLQLFEQITGKNSYIIAFNGLSYAFSYPLIKLILENENVKIKTLIIENYILTALEQPVLQDENLFYGSPPALKLEYLKLLEQTGKLTWRDYYHLLVSSKTDAIITAPIANHFINKMFYKGSYINRQTGCLPAKKFNQLTFKSATGRSLPKIQLQALTNLFKLLRKHHVTVIFIESPLPQPIETAPLLQHYKQRLAKIIKAANFAYIDGANGFPINDHRNFLDKGHLSTRGRALFTREIITKIQVYSSKEKK
jgi:hypothetical protein